VTPAIVNRSGEHRSTAQRGASNCSSCDGTGCGEAEPRPTLAVSTVPVVQTASTEPRARSAVSSPAIEAPAVTAGPIASVSDPAVPEVTLPTVTLPEITTPAVTVPTVVSPNVQLPTIPDLPQLP
jgi:hypothetical protein